MDAVAYLIVPLLQSFEWFDESLQLSLREGGWPQLTRPESMVMMHVQLNINRPSDIARSLRLTRQAVHSTIAGLVERGVFELVDDPDDKRVKMVQLTEMGNAMRQDAQKIVVALTDMLSKRIGAKHVRALQAAFDEDWGDPIICRVREGKAEPLLPRTARIAPLASTRARRNQA
ncbi:MarR family winged helix-turn-helix transcriptional regulator [Sphingobium lactosutens]|uniref:MarR family winged helix-turn-helix transcriptional regulator n=1 Tax=Sphingobium lactosutens TaxID=522773 RepID=UPI002118CC82|nr:helix-turn-helix domain-containing protein [Sphingobium lactosutens]